MKDFVHTIRKLYRDARKAINNVKVKGVNKNLTQKEKKKIKRLKKKLLRKRLYHIIYRMIKGFDIRNAEVGIYYLKRGLKELKEFTKKFPSLKGYYEKTKKFVDKYLDIWALQMEKSVTEGIPNTSNSIESKNSIFKKFAKILKCLKDNDRLEEFYSAVALMENYDVKDRGINKGTSAFMRAGVNLEEYGAHDFFEAVGLEEIVLGKNTSAETNGKENIAA
jgi:hypothetical protein